VLIDGHKIFLRGSLRLRVYRLSHIGIFLEVNDLHGLVSPGASRGLFNVIGEVNKVDIRVRTDVSDLGGLYFLEPTFF